jgi:hypothetical protein
MEGAAKTEGSAKMHAAVAKRHLVYKCQYTKIHSDGKERVCGHNLTYGGFRAHVISHHLGGDSSKWDASQYVTHAISSSTQLTPRAIATLAPSVESATAPATAAPQLQEILETLKSMSERVDATWQLVRSIAVKVSVDSTAAVRTSSTVEQAPVDQAPVVASTITAITTEASQPTTEDAPAQAASVEQPKAPTDVATERSVRRWGAARVAWSEL